MVDIMIPILYDNSQDLHAIGALIGTLSANVVEKNDGTFELNMSIDVNSQYFEQIQIGSVIGAMPNNWQATQYFVVEELTKPIDNIATVYATHLSENIAKLVVARTFTGSSLADTLTKLRANAQSLFQISTNFSSTKSFKNNIPRSLREVLGADDNSLLSVYGGEYLFDNYRIVLMDKRGKDSGIKIVYGNNMSDFTINDLFDFEQSPNAICPYWSSTDGTVVVGQTQYSPLFDIDRILREIAVDLSSEYDTKPSVATLNARAKTLAQSLGSPFRTIQCSYETLSLNDAIALELGDYVTVIHFGYGINVKMRVIETDFNVLLERYNSVTLGDAQKKLTDVIRTTSGTSGFKTLDDQIVNRLNTMSSATGTFKNSTTETKTLANEKVVTITSLALDAGKWIVIGALEFGSQSGGRRWLKLTSSSTSETTSMNDTIATDTNIQTGKINLEKVLVTNQGSPFTMYLKGWQSSTKSVSTTGRIQAIRIA